MPSIADIDSIKTSYYNAGHTGPALLFLHGWACSARLWLRSLWALRQGYRCYALDLPGFGNSAAPPESWTTIGCYTDHVAAFCRSHNIVPAVVIGHSMGGRIALDLARRYPHLAGRVVAVSAAVTGRLGFGLSYILRGRVARTVYRLAPWWWPLTAGSVLSLYWMPSFLGREGMARNSVDMQRCNPRVAVRTLSALVEEDFTPHLWEIRQPVLVITGDLDYTVPPADSSVVAQQVPGARLVMLKGIRHWPMDEDLDAYMDALLPFLPPPDHGIIS